MTRPGPRPAGAARAIGAAPAGEVDNRPGLPAIAYRSGVHGDFLAADDRCLTEPGPPRRSSSLRTPRRRRLHDRAARRVGSAPRTCSRSTPSGWRNESYLRTARERMSLQELGQADRLPAQARASPPRRTLRLRARAAARTFRPRRRATRARPRPVTPDRGHARAGHARAEHPRARRAAADLRDGRGDRGPPGVERDAGDATTAFAPELGRHGRLVRREPALNLKPGDALLLATGSPRSCDTLGPAARHTCPSPPVNRTHVTWARPRPVASDPGGDAGRCTCCASGSPSSGTTRRVDSSRHCSATTYPSSA